MPPCQRSYHLLQFQSSVNRWKGLWVHGEWWQWWVGAGKKGLPVGVCQDFILLLSQWEHKHSPDLAPTCPPLSQKEE